MPKTLEDVADPYSVFLLTLILLAGIVLRGFHLYATNSFRAIITCGSKK
jgi:hypothetical protein